jgi:hypothetical protein
MRDKMRIFLVLVTFIISLIAPMSYLEAQQLSEISFNKGEWDKIEINQYDVSVVWITDIPESYYILDARADLCFFVVSTTNGISTIRVPCKPFVGKIDMLEDKYDECK